MHAVRQASQLPEWLVTGWFLLVKAFWKEGNPIAARNSAWAGFRSDHHESHPFCVFGVLFYLLCIVPGSPHHEPRGIQAQRHLDSALQARFLHFVSGNHRHTKAKFLLIWNADTKFVWYLCRFSLAVQSCPLAILGICPVAILRKWWTSKACVAGRACTRRAGTPCRFGGWGFVTKGWMRKLDFAMR